METMQTIRQLCAYNEWANQRVVRALRESLPVSPKALRALTHLLIAEKLWLARLRENKDTTGYDFWPEMSLAECESLADQTSAAYASLLDELTEEKLNQVATYKNSKGVEYQNSFREILLHVFFHATYHRGQVAFAMREAGGTPAYTDYIAFLREQRLHTTDR
jgi:uncharacterized damage-inducible protein DinB